MQLQFQRNLSVKDRVIRIVIGLILVSLAMMPITTGWLVPSALYIAGGIIIFEATIGYWIVYDMMGWSTRERIDLQ